MKVRILSGNQTGAVVDMPQIDAENAISTGFAELYDPKKDQAALDAKKAGVPGKPTKPSKAKDRQSAKAKRKK